MEKPRSREWEGMRASEEGIPREGKVWRRGTVARWQARMSDRPDWRPVGRERQGRLRRVGGRNTVAGEQVQTQRGVGPSQDILVSGLKLALKYGGNSHMHPRPLVRTAVQPVQPLQMALSSRGLLLCYCHQ